MSGLNRINVVVPGSSSNAASERDVHISRLTVMGISDWWNYRYVDTSPLGIWGYYAFGYDYVDGIVTVATVTCTGMAHPPSGSNLVAMPDPGPGTNTWASTFAPFSISTSSGDGRGGGGTRPSQNNNLWTWPIPGNSPTVVADFTAAISKMTTLITAGTVNYYKYVDSVSGAWSVYAVGLNVDQVGSTGLPTPICTMVTCSGTSESTYR